MLEGVVSEILVHSDLYCRPLKCGGVVQRRAGDDDQKIENDEFKQRIQRTAANKMVQGIALKKRNAYVYYAPDQAADKHDGQRFFIVFQVEQDFAYAKERKSGLFFAFFHTVASVSAPDCISQIF